MKRGFAGTVILLFAGSLASASPWTVTTDKFESVVVQDPSLEAGTLRGRGASGGEIELPLSRVVQLSRSAKAEATKDLTLFLATGDRLVGKPKSFDGTTLVWATTGVGEVAVPIEQALGVLRDSASLDKLSQDRGEDEVRLLNGDTVRGILASANGQTMNVTPAAGGETPVTIDTIGQVLFATPPQGRTAGAASPFRVRLQNGTRVSAGELTIRGETLSLTLPSKASTTVSAGQVVSIEQTGGPVRWLSDRRPTTSEHVPYFGGTFPARFDTGITGEPIRFGGISYAHGIGVHSRSKLVFAIEAGDATFRTRYAIDGDQGYADVDVRVRVDERVVHENKGFKAGTLSPVVEADVKGAKTITLEVDYGQGYDVQDRLNWIEPAMIRDQVR